MKYILGISAFYHDSAACLLGDGKIIAAAQEERFTRIKHDSNYPYNAINFVLKFGNIKLNQVEKIIFFESLFKNLKDCSKPTLHLHLKDLHLLQNLCLYG